MEQIKNVGVVEGKLEGGAELEDERLVLAIDPAMCDAEDTARAIVQRGREGKPMVIVLGNANAGEVTRRMIAELEEHEPIDDVVRDIWPQERQVKRRVGILGGFGHLPMIVLSAAVGPNWSSDYYGPPEDYFNYRLRIREEEVARGMRRPPKKAICSSRRRGRKFKG